MVALPFKGLVAEERVYVDSYLSVCPAYGIVVLWRHTATRQWVKLLQLLQRDEKAAVTIALDSDHRTTRVVAKIIASQPA